jgi:hypothetical protein
LPPYWSAPCPPEYRQAATSAFSCLRLCATLLPLVSKT